MKKLLLILFLLYSFNIFCQKQGNIWYFGANAGVDFNTGSPIALLDGLSLDNNGYSEGTSVISDSSGSLLFYTNGQKLWNKNHQVMPNGSNLFGNFSSTQSSIIVPKPNSSQFFYVFTVDDIWENQLQYGFRYSIVDICLDNGLGDISEMQKNILLLDTVAEKVAATKHSNGTDYWIITHKLYSDAFYTYLLTNNGIADTIVSHIGSVHINAQGQMKVSPNGNKIALAASQAWAFPSCFELFDFDNSTGIVSNHISLTSPGVIVYGVEFSPNNLNLYASVGSSSPLKSGIIEYDLSSGDSVVINNSVTVVHLTTSVLALRGLQLGPDDKIYRVEDWSGKYLQVINSPDSFGLSCNFQDSAIYLGGKHGDIGLPTFISNYSYSNTIFNCTSNINEYNTSKEILVFPNPTSGKFIVKSKGIGKIEVFNIKGTQIYFGKEKEIDLSQESNGIYFIKVITDKQTITKKLIIQ